MGTRADFYVGRGKDAEWIGSYAWDGHPCALAEPVLGAMIEEEYRAAVSAELASRDDSTLPERGWPWSWDDSNTTDYAYAWDGDQLWGNGFGDGWFAVDRNAEQYGQPEEDLNQDPTEFPNMAERKNVRMDRGSGVIVLNFPAGGAR
jgi:hypothetical protein